MATDKKKNVIPTWKVPKHILSFIQSVAINDLSKEGTQFILHAYWLDRKMAMQSQEKISCWFLNRLKKEVERQIMHLA